MATLNTYTGDGSTTLYSLTFEYLNETDVKVQIDGTLTSAYSFANATQILFNTAPANGAEIIIYRSTDVSEPIVSFFAGSSIRAQDLNKANDQIRFSVEEWRSQTVPLYNAVLPDEIDMGGNRIINLADPTSAQDAVTKQYLEDNYFDDDTETIQSGEGWPDNDTTIATTAAIDDRVDVKIDQAITNDIGTDGTGITVTDDGDGTITLGLADNTIDFSKIKDADIVTYAEQNAGSPSWDSDNQLPTTYAAAKRFDTLVQVATPTGSDWEVGKTWLQNDIDKTLSIWNGSAWVAVASGGSFTELTKVVYVDAVNGDDALAGHRISNPKRTIKAAIDDINADPDGDGSIVLVAPGIYGEEFPIDIQKNDISVVGQSLRNCIIHPAIPVADQAGYDVDVPEPNELSTMFRVNSGSYFYGLTLTGMKASGTRGGNSLDTDATYGLPTNQGWNFAFYPGASIKKSPYIQNCTNFSDSQINNVTFTPHTPGEGAAGDLDSAPTGGGILIDGNTPASNSPLRSMVCDSYTHTALNGPGIFVTNNGYCQATSSYSFFGHYHLKTKNGGQANLAASTSDFGSHSLIADGRSTNAIFTATTTVTANDGDTSFTIGAPVAGSPWHGTATRPQDNMLVDIGGNTYPVLSAVANGAGWDVTISRPNPVNLQENLGLNGAVSSGAAVSFFLRSMIASSGHTMEYVGSGNDYRALPENGGVPNDTKQTIELNDGKIWAAITDHRGNFKVGNTFFVDQGTGVVTIAGEASDTVRKSSPTGSAILPAGSTAQRDAAPAAGYIRFNSTDSSFEGYDGSAWGAIGGGATPAGVAGSIQINDGAGALGDVTDFKWDSANTELDVPGDINLDDGGTYTTTIQSITATADRFISFPDATGVVGLVQGTNGALQYNNAGVQGGATDTSVGTSGDITIGANGAASTPPVKLDGTWFSGGTSTTTKPQLLIEPSGSTSTAWSTGGTGLGVNAASGFTGNLLDLQVNGTSQVITDSSGRVGVGTSVPGNYVAGGNNLVVSTTGSTGITIAAGSSSNASLYFADGASGTAAYRGYISYNHASDNLVLGSSGIARATIDSYFRLASGTTGIQFNGDTAAANALDDYEEGTWTPTTYSNTLSVGSASYVKVGRMVTCHCELTGVTSWTASTSNPFWIFSYPFQPDGGTGLSAVGSVSLHNIATSQSGTLSAVMDSNNNRCRIQNNATNSSFDSISLAEMGAQSWTCAVSITYRTTV